MPRSVVRRMPSPNNTNHERLYVRQQILTHKQLLAMDSDPSMAEELRSSERGGHFDPRGPGGSGEIEGGISRRGEDRRRARGRDHIPEHQNRHMHQDLTARDLDPPEHPASLQRGPAWAEDDEDDDGFERFRSHLREQGLDEAAIERAVELGRDHMHRRGTNGRDRHHADDRFPQRAHRSPIADPDKEAHDLEPDGSEAEFLTDHGLDSKRGARDRDHDVLDEIQKLMARIEREPEPRELTGDRRRRHAMDSKSGMTERQKAELFRLFPDMARIGDPSSDGASIIDGTYKNRFEI